VTLSLLQPHKTLHTTISGWLWKSIVFPPSLYKRKRSIAHLRVGINAEFERRLIRMTISHSYSTILKWEYRFWRGRDMPDIRAELAVMGQKLKIMKVNAE
jgi:hypothetical protein